MVHSNSDPAISNQRKDGELRPADSADKTKEARLEKGPVHELKTSPSSDMPHSISDSSIAGRAKNFNRIPKPFRVGLTPTQPKKDSPTEKADENVQSNLSDLSKMRSQSVDQSGVSTHPRPLATSASFDLQR